MRPKSQRERVTCVFWDYLRIGEDAAEREPRASGGTRARNEKSRWEEPPTSIERFKKRRSPVPGLVVMPDDSHYNTAASNPEDDLKLPPGSSSQDPILSSEYQYSMPADRKNQPTCHLKNANSVEGSFEAKLTASVSADSTDGTTLRPYLSQEGGGCLNRMKKKTSIDSLVKNAPPMPDEHGAIGVATRGLDAWVDADQLLHGDHAADTVAAPLPMEDEDSVKTPIPPSRDSSLNQDTYLGQCPLNR